MHRRFHHIFPVLIAPMCMMLALATSAWANELSTATVEIRVSQGDDDAEEDVTNNSMDLSSSDLELVRESNHQIIGIRFQGVMIPHKSNITNAYIQFEIDETDDIYALYEEISGVPEPFFANNKQELVRALASITESVKGAIFHGSAPAPTTSADLGDTVIVAKFDASRRTGSVISSIRHRWAVSFSSPPLFRMKTSVPVPVRPGCLPWIIIRAGHPPIPFSI